MVATCVTHGFPSLRGMSQEIWQDLLSPWLQFAGDTRRLKSSGQLVQERNAGILWYFICRRWWSRKQDNEPTASRCFKSVFRPGERLNWKSCKLASLNAFVQDSVTIKVIQKAKVDRPSFEYWVCACPTNPLIVRRSKAVALAITWSLSESKAAGFHVCFSRSKGYTWGIGAWTDPFII